MWNIEQVNEDTDIGTKNIKIKYDPKYMKITIVKEINSECKQPTQFMGNSGETILNPVSNHEPGTLDQYVNSILLVVFLVYSCFFTKRFLFFIPF